MDCPLRREDTELERAFMRAKLRLIRCKGYEEITDKLKMSPNNNSDPDNTTRNQMWIDIHTQRLANMVRLGSKEFYSMGLIQKRIEILLTLHTPSVS